MKYKLTQLSRRYATALRTYLQPGNGERLRSASILGRSAVRLGIETLELARIHEQILPAIVLPGYSSHKRTLMTKRASLFFNQVNLSIEETHRAAPSVKTDLSQMKKMLSQRTRKLAATTWLLQKSVHQRRVMKDAFAKNDQRHDRSLEESLQLQNHLRQLTHRVIAAEEHERAKISHELQDEIVQTLIGINIRLLSLKQAAQINTKGLKKHIAKTQRMVVKSAKSVRRFARELKTLPPTTNQRLLPVT